jgi:hypothetical protein
MKCAGPSWGPVRVFMMIALVLLGFEVNTWTVVTFGGADLLLLRAFAHKSAGEFIDVLGRSVWRTRVMAHVARHIFSFAPEIWQREFSNENSLTKF